MNTDLLLKKGLLLKTDGTIIETHIDMSLNTNNIELLLNNQNGQKGQITFLGQILREPENTNAIIIYGSNAYRNKLPKNKATLPKPFENDIYGDIFIISMDKNSQPQDFTFDDYNEYLSSYDTKYKKKYYF